MSASSRIFRVQAACSEGPNRQFAKAIRASSPRLEHGVLSAAFRITMILRMIAVMATFAGLPRYL